MIQLRLVLIPDGVIEEVADRHDKPPVFSDRVLAVSSRYSSYPTNVGRVVWREVSTTAVELTESGLPKPKPSPVPRATPPGQYVVDGELLRRVRDGLDGL